VSRHLRRRVELIIVPEPTTEIDWLDDDEQRAWRAFIEVQGDLLAALERDLEAAGITLGDYRVLVLLSEVDERALRMCDLADRLQLSPSGVTRRLDGLVASGLVRREGHPDDRRVMMAVLTDAGLETLRTVAPHHVASVRRRIFDHLDADQVGTFGEIFARIGAALDPSTDRASTDRAGTDLNGAGDALVGRS
jgi:DNA-binding MarR family transcriptional regulator